MKTKEKHPIEKAARALLALVLGIGLMLPAGLALPGAAEAATTTVDVVKPGTYDTPYGSSLHCRKWTIDGHRAFCVDPALSAPATGSYSARTVKPSDFNSTSHYRSFIGIMYYSQGGPGSSKGTALMTAKDYKGNAMTSDSRYAAEHIVAAYYFHDKKWGETFEDGTTDSHGNPNHNYPSDAYKTWFDNYMADWAAQIIQLTNDADMEANGGYTFDEFASQVLVVPRSTTQTLVTWTHKPFAKIKKSSARTDITDGNPLYSLAGAKYGVYGSPDDAVADNDRIATLTTGAEGKATYKKLEPGTYWVKEVQAPAGYKLDQNPHKIKLVDGEATILELSDEPGGDPDRIAKYDQDRNKAAAQGSAEIAGGEFTFRYYAGYYNASNLPASATRTWVMRAGSDGVADLRYGNSSKVSGDDFYYNSDGEIIVPLGTVTAVETKAPAGYRLGYVDANGAFQAPKLYVSHVVADSSYRNGTKLVPVNYSSSEVSSSDSTPIARDSVIRGDVTGVKVDHDSADGKAQGAATLAGAKIGVYNKSANAVVSPQTGAEVGTGGLVCTLTTDADGAFSSSATDVNGWSAPATFGGGALAYGTYELREDAPPEGYLPNTDWSTTVTITAQGQVADATGGSALADAVKRGDFDFYKVDGPYQRPMANVPFVLTSCSPEVARSAPPRRARTSSRRLSRAATSSATARASSRPPRRAGSSTTSSPLP